MARLKLHHVFGAKIAFTALFWSAPLLFAPRALFAWVGVTMPQPEFFCRLLGAAYFTLLMGYIHGYREAKMGGPATLMVFSGIVSNGAAATILLSFGLHSAYKGWPLTGQIYMWGSGIATMLITIGLGLKGPRHKLRTLFGSGTLVAQSPREDR